HFPFERLEQLPCAPVVDRAARHVERLDLLRRSLAQRLVVRVADREVFAHHAAEAGEAKAEALAFGAIAVADRHRQPPLIEREPQRPWPAMSALDRADGGKAA